MTSPIVAAQLVGHRRARRLLDQLLVAALERALALAERPHLAVLVGEDLELDVPRLLDEALEVDVGVLEAGHRPRAVAVSKARAHLVDVAHDAHAAPAAAARGLEDDREADALGLARRRASASASTPVPGRSGRPKRSRLRARATLSPQARIASGVGPMKVEPALLADLARTRRSRRGSRSPGGSRRRRVISAALMIAGMLR